MKNLLPVLMLAVEMGNVGDQIGRAKGASRYTSLLDLFDEVTALGKVDFKLVDDEAKAVLADPVKKAELLAAVKEKLDIHDDKLEVVIEEGLGILADAHAVVNRAIALSKGLKSA